MDRHVCPCACLNIFQSLSLSHFKNGQPHVSLMQPHHKNLPILYTAEDKAPELERLPETGCFSQINAQCMARVSVTSLVCHLHCWKPNNDHIWCTKSVLNCYLVSVRWDNFTCSRYLLFLRSQYLITQLRLKLKRSVRTRWPTYHFKM